MRIIREIFRPPPKALYLEPFFGCNYRCPFCIHGSGHQVRNVQLDPHTFERLKPVIQQISHVHMTGLGEPFLNPHLPDYLHYIREHGKTYYINTNGSLLQDAHIDFMTTSQCELSVSLDAGDRSTYETVRRGGNWDSIVARLRRVAEIKASRGSRYPLLYLTFHVNALNLMSMRTVPELARDLGIDAVKFSWTMLPEAHRACSIFPHLHEAHAVLHRVSAQLLDAGIQVRSEASFSRHARGCWNLGSMAFVAANGAVAACCSWWLTVGHLEENSFDDIWNGMPRRAFALAMVNGKPEGTCEQCAQIEGAERDLSEQDFLKPSDLEVTILAEKKMKPEKLPSLEGLDRAFRSSVEAFLSGEFQAAVHILSNLETTFPELFEIKNNLAVAHYYLGNSEKCREILDAITTIPHNEKLLQQNLELLQQS